MSAPEWEPSGIMVTVDPDTGIHTLTMSARDCRLIQDALERGALQAESRRNEVAWAALRDLRARLGRAFNRRTAS